MNRMIEMMRYEFDETFRKIVESSCIPFAIYQFLDQRIVTLLLSDGFCELFGLESEEAGHLLDQDMYRDAHPDDVARIASLAYTFATEGGEYDVVYRNRAPGEKEYRVIHAQGRHVYTDEGVRLAVIWYTDEGSYENEVREEKQLNSLLNGMLREESLIRENYYDVLTGLPNMSYFQKLADIRRKQMEKKGDLFTILYFDLNGMKDYNRKYGFAEGDRLLSSVAVVLKKYFGSENCGRPGQDHFTVCTDSLNLERILHNIFGDIEKLNDGRSLPVRVGIYQDRFEKVGISTACDRAKTACDQDKSSYFSNFDYYDENLRIASLKRNYILDNFEKALRERWIRAFFQPIVRTVHGQVCDEEALARWIDPNRGIFSPADFIPILEDAKLLYKLDLYMVEQILEYIKRKQKEKIQVVPVSVNISRSDFCVCDMVSEICRRMDKAGIKREFLTIEITESDIGLEPDFLKLQVKRFHEEGFKVWMDDFGSGYSSLYALQYFDFDLIKLDMGFMRNFHVSGKNHVILKELMTLSIKLGVDTVAEGVENEEQIAFLREVGCDKVQGYYYSQPSSVDTIIERYQTGVGIGFENVRESAYYEVVSRTNLNDPAVKMDNGFDLYDYYSTVPMGILEIRDQEYYLLRYNKNYAVFVKNTMGEELPGVIRKNYRLQMEPEPNFRETVEKCLQTGEWELVENGVENGVKIHSFVRKITKNPVSGAEAVLVMVLSMLK